MQIETDKLNSNLLVKLLTGVVYYGDPLWKDLVNTRSFIQDYFKPLGLDLNIHESDGYGFLSQIYDDESDSGILRIVKRHPLSFEVSLLLVILREELERFETKATDQGTLFLEKYKIKELIELYFRTKKDEIKLIKEIDRYIVSVVKLGFLKEITTTETVVYKVMPIIKARINPDFLMEFKRKLDAI